MGLLDGKLALVTGASRGVGRATAERLGAEGAFVVIADIDEDAGLLAAEQMSQAGTQVEFLELDVASESGWRAAVDQVGKRHARLDILVNNAGVNDRKGVLDSDGASWRRIFSINTDGPFFGIRACVPLMPAGGAIVNIVSTAALGGHSFAAYSASKWALRGLSRCAALELADKGIRVNAICPGLILTDINRGQPYLDRMIGSIPLRRGGRAEEVAEMALFLCSSASSFVTGQEFVIDGGMTSGAVVGY